MSKLEREKKRGNEKEKEEIGTSGQVSKREGCKDWEREIRRETEKHKQRERNGKES